jgi:SAM-dependent methyltransferase
MSGAEGVGGSVVFDRAAGYYDDTRGLPAEVSEQVTDRMEAAAGPDARFLELGAGTGRIALPLQRRGRTVFGVDLSVPMLERYRAKAAAAGLPRPPVVRGDISRLPVRDGCVDAVVEVHVLHLIPAWRQVLAEARRVLAPGGVLLMGKRGSVSHGGGPWRETRRRWRALVQGLGGRPQRPGAQTHEEIAEALAELGGRVEVLAPVVWQVHETWGESLRLLEQRLFSDTWLVDDATWQASLGPLRAQIEASGVDLDVPVPVTITFELLAVRF